MHCNSSTCLRCLFEAEERRSERLVSKGDAWTLMLCFSTLHFYPESRPREAWGSLWRRTTPTVVLCLLHAHTFQLLFHLIQKHRRSTHRNWISSFKMDVYRGSSERSLTCVALCLHLFPEFLLVIYWMLLNIWADSLGNTKNKQHCELSSLIVIIFRNITVFTVFINPAWVSIKNIKQI